MAEGSSVAARAVCEADEPVLRTLAGLTVRTVRATDKLALSDLFDRLSPRSRHYRFLGPKTMLSARDLEDLTDLDHIEREALALVAPDGRFIAVARYGPVSDDSNAAEVSLTVADEWQDRGVGRALATLLIAEARRRRIARLAAMTLAENYPARKLLHGLGFTVNRVDGDVISLEMQLADWEASPSLPRTRQQPNHSGGQR